MYSNFRHERCSSLRQSLSSRGTSLQRGGNDTYREGSVYVCAQLRVALNGRRAQTICCLLFPYYSYSYNYIKLRLVKTNLGYRASEIRRLATFFVALGARHYMPFN